MAKDTAARPAMRDVAAELSALRQGGLVGSTEAQLSKVMAQTVHLADTRHTTLGQATGQLHKGSRLRPRHLAVAAGCVLLIGLGVLALTYGHGPLQGMVNRTGTIHWRIRTEPAGAEVIAEPEGRVLGLTPLDYTATTAPGAQAVVLRQHGFMDRRLLLSRSSSEERSETLAPTPSVPAAAKTKPSRPPEPARPAPPKSPTASSSRSSGSRSSSSSRRNQSVVDSEEPQPF